MTTGLAYYIDISDLDNVKRLVDTQPECLWSLDYYGTNLLVNAVHQPNIEITKFLLEKGLSPNKRNKYGEYIVSFAFEHTNQLELILSVMDKKLLNKKNNRGLTPLDYAIMHNKEQARRLIIDNGAVFGDREKLLLQLAKYVKNNDQKNMSKVMKTNLFPKDVLFECTFFL